MMDLESENKSDHAVKSFLKIANRYYTKSGMLPKSDLSRSTEYRVLKDLKESGLIEKTGKKWKISDQGKELLEQMGFEV